MSEFLAANRKQEKAFVCTKCNVQCNVSNFDIVFSMTEYDAITFLRWSVLNWVVWAGPNNMHKSGYEQITK